EPTGECQRSPPLSWVGVSLGSGGRLLLGRLLEQALHGGRCLGANALPVRQTILGDAQHFLAALGRRVVEAQALDEAAIAAHALVGDDDVEERTALGAAARESNNDHDESFGWKRPRDNFPQPLFLPRLRHATGHPASDTQQS